MRWKPIITGMVLVGLVGGVGYAVRDKLLHPATSSGSGAGGPPPGPPGMGPPGGAAGSRNAAIAVQAGTVAREDVPIWFDGIGTVQAFNSVTVRARVDGELQRLDLREGQLVKAGDVLAIIDSRPLQAQLAQAQAKKAQDEAQLANAKRDLERNLSLREFAAKQTVDTQRAQVVQYEAQIRADDAAIDAVQVQLNYTTITAPINGRIGLRSLDQGNMVRSSDQSGLVTITQVQPIAVVFTLPEKLLPAIIDAQTRGEVPVQALDRQGKTVLGAGTLAVIDNLIDTGTGTIRLKATLPNDPQRLWPGGIRQCPAAVHHPARGDHGRVHRRAARPAGNLRLRHQGRPDGRTASDQGRPHRRGQGDHRRRTDPRRAGGGRWAIPPATGVEIRLVDPPTRGQTPGQTPGQPTGDAAPPPSPASSPIPSGQAAPLASGERPRERSPRDPNNPDAPRRNRPPTDGAAPTDTGAATPRPAREPS